MILDPLVELLDKKKTLTKACEAIKRPILVHKVNQVMQTLILVLIVPGCLSENQFSFAIG